MEGQRFDEYKGQFMYIALDDAMRCFDSVRDSIQALSQGALGANMEHAERTAKDNATRMTVHSTVEEGQKINKTFLGEYKVITPEQQFLGIILCFSMYFKWPWLLRFFVKIL